MSLNTNDVFDDILVMIAKNIYRKGAVNDLGKELGCRIADIARANDENAQQGGSHMGTLELLRTWRDRQTGAEERENLKAALEKAGLVRLVDKYLSADDVVQHPKYTPPTSMVHGASSQSSEREKGDKEVKPDGNGYYTQTMKQAYPSEEQLDPEKNYKMDVLPKGHMFIFNMSEAREGSDVDVRNITHVFNEIGYRIQTCFDLTAKDLKYELGNFVDSPCHEGMCSAVFVFMGNGNGAGIECTDGEVVTTKFIQNKVSGMKTMNGKPKMIFFQFCRLSIGHRVEKVKTDQAEAAFDFLMVHATTDGNVAYRNPINGTWFIQMLCEVLLESAHVSDLSTMLEQVTGKVGKMAIEETSKEYRQIPEVVKQGISKKIYFLPKYPPAKND